MSQAVLDLAKLESTGSGKGWSYWSNWLGCAKRAALIEAAQAKGLDLIGNSHMRVGSIVHKLLELHEGSTQFRDIVIKNRELMPDEVKEAWEIFSHYRANYAPGYWGKVLGREILVGNPDNLSGRLDLLLQISTKEHLAHWRAAGVPFIHKGTYIVDYKVHTPQEGKVDDVFFRNSPQFTNYWNLYAGLPKARKLAGTLVMVILRQERRNPPVHGILITPPGAEQQEVLWVALERAAFARNTVHWEDNKRVGYYYQPNVTLCGKGSFRCPFYLKANSKFSCDLHSPFVRKAG